MTQAEALKSFAHWILYSWTVQSWIPEALSRDVWLHKWKDYVGVGERERDAKIIGTVPRVPSTLTKVP